MKNFKRKAPITVQPYTFDYHGKYVNEPIDFELFIYNDLEVKEVQSNDIKDIEKALSDLKPKDMVWLNVHGLHEPEVFRVLGATFSIPNSLLHEVLSPAKRSRLEETDMVICSHIKSVNKFLQNGNVEVIPVSMILKENTLLSFQEKHNNLFDVVRERIRTKTGSVRRKGEDYLFYLLIDSMLENYYTLLDRLEEILELVVLEVKKSKTPLTLESLQDLKTCFLDLKRVIIPLKEVLSSVINSTTSAEYPFLEDANVVYFSKLYNKTLEIADQIDDELIQIENATNFFFSMQSHRMNEIMKVLTIVSVLFIPLTFIVGVYGMNFMNIPELSMPNGYFYVWGVMLVLVVLMLGYFKWKKWF